MIKKCQLFKVFSNEIRMKILKMLLKNKFCVSKIVDRLNVSQPTVTQHLKQLQNCGLVKSEKVGFWVHYSANKSGIKKCRNQLKKFIEILESAEECSKNCNPEKCEKKQ